MTLHPAIRELATKIQADGWTDATFARAKGPKRDTIYVQLPGADDGYHLALIGWVQMRRTQGVFTDVFVRFLTNTQEVFAIEDNPFLALCVFAEVQDLSPVLQATPVASGFPSDPFAEVDGLVLDETVHPAAGW